MSETFTDPALEDAALIGPITRETANNVLWFHRRDEGYSPGSGMERLLETFAHFDNHNRTKLRREFPSLGAAFEISTRPGGLDILREIASAA